MKRTACLLVALALSASAFAGQAPKFKSPPTAKRGGADVKIEFAVSAPTDVTVWVEDARGNVIRRIGAAKLGATKVPSPFKPATLSQSLVWDGKDSKGKAAPAGCKVKVALGMRAKLAEILGQDDTDLAGIHGIGVRPGSGELYVLAEGPGDGKHTVNLSVLDREGKHLRTLIPAPSTLPWDKAEKLGAFKLADGGWMPRLFHPTGRCFTPLTGRPHVNSSSHVHPSFQGLAISSAGTVYRVNRVWTRYNLAMHAADGGAPGKTTIGPWLPKHVVAPKMALSPDGKTLYIVGLRDSINHYKSKPGHAVWQLPVDPSGEPKPLIGDPVTAGSGPKLSSPTALSVDEKGRIYVADHGNGRVAQFDPSGKLLAELRVKEPGGLAVSPDGEKIYVLRRLPRVKKTRFFELERYDGMKADKPAIVLKLNCGMATGMLMAVDFGAKTPVVWIANSSKYCRFQLLRIEDLGAKFGDSREVDSNGGVANMPSLGVDAETDDLFVRRTWYRWLIFNGGTGKAVALDTSPDRKGSVMDVGPDGSRWWLDRNLKGAKIPTVRTGPDNVKLLPLPGGKQGLPLKSDHLNSRGFCVGPDGSVYAVQYAEKEGGRTAVLGFKPDGSPIGGNGGILIENLTLVACSPRVDSRGRIYVADSLRPEDAIVPEIFRDNEVQLAKSGDVHNDGQDYYPVTYGSILRFGPAGGKVELLGEASSAGKDPVILEPKSYRYKGPGVKVPGYPRTFARVAVRGCDLVLPGISAVSTNTGHRIYCRCGHAQFDIDGFDRLIVPDATQFQVRIYDCEGNLLHTFGRYGNADDRGQKKPGVPLAWGELVVTSHKFIYVGDNLNRRVMKVKLEYAVEESCPAP